MILFFMSRLFVAVFFSIFFIIIFTYGHGTVCLLVNFKPRLRAPYSSNIKKAYLYNFEPLKTHLYIEKLGFTGVFIIFLISAQKHRL